MTLFELAYACYLYSNTEDYAKYNDSYLEFMNATNRSPDLGNSHHRLALLAWLRKWGCRQFALDHEKHASDEILDWWNRAKKIPFADDRYLWELGEEELESAGFCYRKLLVRTASYRKRNGEAIPVSIGPTGASKILFAIRPNALAPWDKGIRKKFKCSEFIITGVSLGAEKAVERTLDKMQREYVKYLRKLKVHLEEIETHCLEYGFQLRDLPGQLGRIHSSVPKLIDDYYWITMRESMPDLEELELWAKDCFPHWFRSRKSHPLSKKTFGRSLWNPTRS